MDSRRTILVILLLVLSFFMYQQWLLKDPANTPGINSASAPQSEMPSNGAASQQPEQSGIPQASSSAVPAAQPGASQGVNTGDTVRVTTDVLDLRISLRGGDIVRAELLEHAEELGEEARYTILFQRPGELHIAQSGLIGPDGTDTAAGRPIFSAQQTHFELRGDELRVPLTYERDNGVTVTKEFVFRRGDYAVNLNQRVENNSGDTIEMA